jgi:hypothetical protein
MRHWNKVSFERRVIQIIVLVVVIFWGKYTAQGQSGHESMCEFNNINELGLQGCSTISKSVSNGKQLIILGELHNVSVSDSLRASLVIMLKNSISTLAIEYSESYGYLLNRYLECGEVLYLDTAFSSATGNMSESQLGYKKVLDEIRIYNKGVAAKKKIKVIGVDVERHSLSLPIAVINDMIRRQVLINNNIASMVLDGLINLREKSWRNVAKGVRKIWTTAEVQDFLAQTSMTTGDSTLSNVIKGLNAYYSEKKFMKNRDAYIFHRLQAMPFEDFNYKVYLQVGLFHTIIDPYHITLAQYLNEDEFFKKIVLLGRIEYLDSLDPNNTIYSKVSKGERKLLVSEDTNWRALDFKTRVSIIMDDLNYYDFRVIVQ